MKDGSESDSFLYELLAAPLATLQKRGLVTVVNAYKEDGNKRAIIVLHGAEVADNGKIVTVGSNEEGKNENKIG